MNILITGGKGLIGRPLTQELRSSGHRVLVTTRRKTDATDEVQWSPPDPVPRDIMSDIDAVINLAGEPIAPQRWTERRKERIASSRINTTRAIVQSIKRADHKPKVLVSASAVGIYGPCGDEYITEDTPPASDFLARVCVQWEAEALRAEDEGVRVVLIRTGGVLDAAGGALTEMMTPFKLYVGGPIGSGKQWFSWIHRDDETGIIKYALEHDFIKGPVNATAPEPVTNNAFSRALGRALHRPSFLTVPGFIVKLTLGELGSVLLTGQRVIPERALKAGYQFKYHDVNDALRAIFSRN